MPSDPNFALVSGLLHFDETNGSTVFTDESNAPLAYTRHGNAIVSTAESRFGGSSLYLPDGDSWLYSASSDRWNPGANDWTIECHCYAASFTDRPHLISLSDNAGSWEIRLLVDAGRITGRVYHGGSYKIDISGASTLVTSTWHHAAFVRHGSDFLVFVDGEIAAQSTNTLPMPAATPHCAIGSVRSSGYGGYQWVGYIDDARITIGVARYTGAFDPPDSPFPNSAAAYRLAGPALYTDGNVATLARAWRHDTGAHVGDVVPDPVSGLFAIEAGSAAQCDVTIYRDGYRPLTHGPITPVEVTD